MAAGAESAAARESQRDNRPPRYVPTKREPGAARVGLRDSLNGSELSSMKNES